MGDVHPHWHTTEADAQPALSVDALSVPTEPTNIVIPAGSVAISRRPAAIVGILMVLGIGFTLFQGMGGLLGQLATDSGTTVIITSTGFLPPKVMVHPGDSIVWKNQDQIPHILYSDTLMTRDEKPLQTSPIFSGASLTITVPSTAVSGDYVYASRTKSAFTGTITVEALAVSSSSVSSTEVAPVSSMSSSSFSSTSPMVGTQSSAENVVPQDGGIPQNPYTVGTTIPPVIGKGSPSTFQTQTITQHLPTTQPSSGPGGLWVIIGLSGGFLLLITRKAFVVS